MNKEKRIEIRVPDAYKGVLEEVWADLEKVLYSGFLVASTSIAGHQFTFKTVNQNEIKLLEFSKTSQSQLISKIRFRDRFIAMSILNVDGSHILHRRFDHLDKLTKTIAKLPSFALDEIMKNLSLLNEKYYKLNPLIEVYVHENRSRFKWMHVKSSPINSCLNTGIPGTDELGMNMCQQAWVALNQIQDRREEMEKDWAHAKFIGSCFAGKGIRSIDEKDRARHEKEKQEREENKRKILYRYLNDKSEDEEPEDLVRLPDGKMARVVKKFKAQSAEELARELSSALSGEKDYHDMIIEEKQKEVASRAKEIEHHRFDMYKQAQYPELENSASIILGGKKEADAYINRMRMEQEKRFNIVRPSDLDEKEESSDES